MASCVFHLWNIPSRILPWSKLCRNTQLIGLLLREYPTVHRGFHVGFGLMHNSHLTITYVNRKAEEDKQWLISFTPPTPGPQICLAGFYMHCILLCRNGSRQKLLPWAPATTRRSSAHLSMPPSKRGKMGYFVNCPLARNFSSLSRCCYRRCCPNNPLNNRR